MKEQIKFGLGPHLTLDLYGCNKERLLDTTLIHKILNELPEKIGMTKISKPSVSFFPTNPLNNQESFDQGGISAFILIAESHITIHTFADQDFASIDIFSCKSFDIEFSKKYFIKSFEAKKAETNLINRGKEFPKKIPLAKPIVIQERNQISKKKN